MEEIKPPLCSCPWTYTDKGLVRHALDQFCPVHAPKKQELPHCPTCKCEVGSSKPPQDNFNRDISTEGYPPGYVLAKPGTWDIASNAKPSVVDAKTWPVSPLASITISVPQKDQATFARVTEPVDLSKFEEVK